MNKGNISFFESVAEEFDYQGTNNSSQQDIIGPALPKEKKLECDLDTWY